MVYKLSLRHFEAINKPCGEYKVRQNSMMLPIEECNILESDGLAFSSDTFVKPLAYAPIRTDTPNSNTSLFNADIAAVITSGLLQLKRRPSTCPVGE